MLFECLMGPGGGDDDKADGLPAFRNYRNYRNYRNSLARAFDEVRALP